MVTQYLEALAITSFKLMTMLVIEFSRPAFKGPLQGEERPSGSSDVLIAPIRCC